MLFPFKLSLYFLKNDILEISGLVFFHQIINHDPRVPWRAVVQSRPGFLAK